MMTFTLPEALAIAGVPHLVKEAAALPAEYSFGSRDATVCSFVKAAIADAEPMVKEACTDHARFWNVLEDCERLVQKLAAYEPPSLSEHDFALVIDSPTGRVYKYAAFDRDSVVDAGTALYDNRFCYPLALRKQAAVEILRRAIQHDAALPEYVNQWLHKAAGLGLMSRDSMLRAFHDRVPFVDDQLALQKLGEFVENVDGEALFDQGFIKQAQEVLEQFDLEHQLHRHYPDGISLPEELIDDRYTTCSLEKLAGLSKYAVTLTNGHELDVTTIDPSRLEALDPAMTKMGADELAAVLPTLPRPDADLLVRLL